MLFPQVIACVKHGTYSSIEFLACLVLVEHEVDGQLTVSANEDCLVLPGKELCFNVGQTIPGSPNFCHIVGHFDLGICVVESFPT